MTFFMVELAASDIAKTASWYEIALAARVELVDAERGFVLLAMPNSPTKLALKRGKPIGDGTLLHFRVDNLAAEVSRLAALGIHAIDAGKTSEEGYTRARYADPDGRGVVLFEVVINQNFIAESTK